MRSWKPQEAMKRPLLSPSEAAPACRSAQAETFGVSIGRLWRGQGIDCRHAAGQAVFKSIRLEDIE